MNGIICRFSCFCCNWQLFCIGLWKHEEFLNYFWSRFRVKHVTTKKYYLTCVSWFWEAACFIVLVCFSPHDTINAYVSIYTSITIHEIDTVYGLVERCHLIHFARNSRVASHKLQITHSASDSVWEIGFISKINMCATIDANTCWIKSTTTMYTPWI